MSKSVLISMKPKWCEFIAGGKKTIEVRKTRPKLEPPFKCYIYCTKNGNDYNPNQNFWKMDSTGFNHLCNGKVIGEFVCDKVYNIDAEHVPGLKDAFHGISCDEFLAKSCLSAYELLEYLTAPERQRSIEYKQGYGWHISDLVIYDMPKKLSEFRRHDPTYDFSVFGEVCRTYPINRPPQSWCYVIDDTNYLQTYGAKMEPEAQP